MRLAANISLFLYCCLALHAHADGQDLHQAPIKIMCIGDSITQGGNLDEEFTYRLPLYQLLKQKGVKASFIGTRTDGLNAAFHWPVDFDAHHEGFYGATTDYVRNAIRRDLSKLPSADIAIIDLGSNDERSADVGKAVIEPLRDIISQLRTRNPQVKIFIIQIPGIYQNLGMHFRIWLMAREISRSDSPITTIPLYLGWDMKRDTFDGSHPNIRGQNRMAQAIFSALEPILPK